MKLKVDLIGQEVSSDGWYIKVRVVPPDDYFEALLYLGRREHMYLETESWDSERIDKLVAADKEIKERDKLNGL